MIKITTALEAEISREQFDRLYEITVTAYRETEKEMWGENYVRISGNEYRELFDQNRILIALIGDEVVGGVFHKMIAANTYSFGLLAADFSRSGQGIGRALVERVEEEALRNGCEQIRIEILRPKGMDVPSKTIIAEWYERMGYKYTHSEDFAVVQPEKGKRLLVPSDFDYYVKEVESRG